MLEIRSQVEVDRPADDVFAYIADPSNNPQWQGGMVSCRWTTEPPIQVGSVYEQHARMMGKDIRSTFEVTAFEPGRSISIETIESTFPIQVTRSVEPLGEGRCRVHAHVRGDASGVFKLAAPLMKRMVKRSVDGDYARLKQHLET